MSILAWITENASLITLSIVALLGLAKVVTKWTASEKDDEIVSRVETVVNGGVARIEALLKKDLNGDGKIG